jgi:hypothetical protein
VPPYYKEALALRELLCQAGFQQQDLLFMPEQDHVSITIMLDGDSGGPLKRLENLTENAFYPIKAADFSTPLSPYEVFLELLPSVMAWQDATPEDRQALLDQAEVRLRVVEILTDLGAHGLLPLDGPIFGQCAH